MGQLLWWGLYSRLRLGMAAPQHVCVGGWDRCSECFSWTRGGRWQREVGACHHSRAT